MGFAMSVAFRPRASLLGMALAAALSGGIVSTPAFAASATAGIDIPYTQFTLPNGLRVIVHEDRKAPVVSVAIWYHVGSKDEPAWQDKPVAEADTLQTLAALLPESSA